GAVPSATSSENRRAKAPPPKSPVSRRGRPPLPRRSPSSTRKAKKDNRKRNSMGPRAAPPGGPTPRARAEPNSHGRPTATARRQGQDRGERIGLAMSQWRTINPRDRFRPGSGWG